MASNPKIAKAITDKKTAQVVDNSDDPNAVPNTPIDNTKPSIDYNTLTKGATPTSNSSSNYMDAMKDYMNQVQKYVGMRFPITPTKTPNIPAGPGNGGIQILSRLTDLGTNFLAGYDKAISLGQQAATMGLENMGKLASYNIMRPGQVETTTARVQNRANELWQSAEPMIDNMEAGIRAGIASKNSNAKDRANLDNTLTMSTYKYLTSMSPEEQASANPVIQQIITTNLPKVLERAKSALEGKYIPLTDDERNQQLQILQLQHDNAVSRLKSNVASVAQEGMSLPSPIQPSALFPQERLDKLNQYNDFNKNVMKSDTNQTPIGASTLEGTNPTVPAKTTTAPPKAPPVTFGNPNDLP